MEAQKKEEKRQEEEELKNPRDFLMQVMASGFSLFEEALLDFGVWDPNIEWYKKLAAAFQNAIWCYYVIYDERI